jgi:transcriptional regulator with XRE-family HTH domain
MKQVEPKRTAVQDAVLDLRHRLGMTQERFALALHVGLVTVARWERSREPTGISLARLELLAIQLNQQELANIFHTAQLLDAANLMIPERGRQAGA